jgi:hypothetical protein
MEDLLQDLGVGDETLSIGHRTFNQPLGVNLARMWRAHEVHRDVGIDEDHPARPE